MSHSKAVLMRLAHIEFLLLFRGWLSRNDLMDQFGIGEAAATRDFKHYNDLCPGNMRLNKATKRWEIDESAFQACFPQTTDVVTAFGKLRNSVMGESLGVAVTGVPRLSMPKIEVLSAVTRAIANKKTLRVQNVPASREPEEIVIVPHSLVDNGLRWHVRAYDRNRECFWDFVLGRIKSAEVMQRGAETHETVSEDEQWNRLVRLELAPHPNCKNVSNPEAIALEYNMVDDVLVHSVRAAVAGYWLRLWNVDCSLDQSEEGKQYQLYLKNPMTLYDVKSATLAPGYDKSHQ